MDGPSSFSHSKPLWLIRLELGPPGLDTLMRVGRWSDGVGSGPSFLEKGHRFGHHIHPLRIWGINDAHLIGSPQGDMSEALAPSGPSVRTLAMTIRVPPPSLACEEEHGNHSSHSRGCWVLCPAPGWSFAPSQSPPFRSRQHMGGQAEETVPEGSREGAVSP